MRKLKRAASSRGIPSATAAPMVEPERLIPGTMASAWARPTPSTRLQVKSREALRGMRSDAYRMSAVVHSDQPTR